MAKPSSRRTFIKRTLMLGAGTLCGAVGYSAIEAQWICVVEERITIPNLPRDFTGKRIALLTDLHHGPYTGLSYIEAIVEKTKALRPDMICLTGDFIHRGGKYTEPCISTLAGLRAPLGVFGVLGNHDNWADKNVALDAFRKAGIVDLINGGQWLTAGSSRLRIAGIDDLWTGRQDIAGALGDARADDACILLSHNPDYVEVLTDKRVGLILSGHTHGGQVVLPLIGAPWVPSSYGNKYLRGLVQGPMAQVYVSRGLGTVTPPLRFCSPPEINVLELV